MGCWSVGVLSCGAAGPSINSNLLYSITPFSNGGHGVTAALRPVTALVSVQIRLATPISDGPKLIGYPPPIRRAYRPWRKPWRSGFDSRHGVPPFDHATCPSDFAEPC